MGANLAQLPVQAYSDFPNNFLGMGGLSAILGPAVGSNPFAAIGLKLLQARFMQDPKLNVQATLPVSIVEIKDSAYDRSGILTRSSTAYVDIYSRRGLVAGSYRRPRGG